MHLVVFRPIRGRIAYYNIHTPTFYQDLDSVGNFIIFPRDFLLNGSAVAAVLLPQTQLDGDIAVLI